MIATGVHRQFEARDGRTCRCRVWRRCAPPSAALRRIVLLCLLHAALQAWTAAALRSAHELTLVCCRR